LKFLSKLNYKHVLRFAYYWFQWRQTQYNLDFLAMFTTETAFLKQITIETN